METIINEFKEIAANPKKQLAMYKKQGKKVIGVLYNLTQPQGLLFQPVAGNRSAVLCDISILHYLYFLLHRHHLCFR